MEFRNRRRELAWLNERYARPGAELAVLYGRRRVGKTTLLYEWCKVLLHLYFFAARLSDRALLAEFSAQVAAALSQPERTFADWSAALAALADLAARRRFVVIIDEYPYLAASVPGLSTLLQRAWDTHQQHTRLFLCLTGSSHSVVRQEILDGRAPLYRRHTWAYELQAAGMVEHRTPLTRIRDDGRQGTWHITDPFLRFWHRWVAPHRALLEIDQGKAETLSRIRNRLSQIVAPVWEEVARHHLLAASGRGTIAFPVEEVGLWWSRDCQIDGVGVNRSERRVIFGEARWCSTRLTQADVDSLAKRSLAWLRGDSARWDVHYAFFARRFGSVATGPRSEGKVHLFTPQDVVGG